MAKRRPEDYIDNKKFLEELIQYKKLVRAARKEDKPIPGVS